MIGVQYERKKQNMRNLKELRVEKGISQKELAAILQVPPNTYNQWENGKREPDYEMISKIADYFGVTVDYLLGRDSCIANHPHIQEIVMNNRIKELRQKHNVTQADLAKHIGIAQNTLSYWENGKYDIDNQSLKVIADYFKVSTDYILCRDNISKTDTFKSYDNIFRIEKKRYPLLGDIACGQPIFADEEHESYVMVGGEIDADFCLRAKGDSMIGARILDGDIVFIKETTTVQNGDIAAVIIGDEATLKRVYYYPEKGKLVLNAENPKYEPFVYVENELNDIRILGKAVAFHSIVR